MNKLRLITQEHETSCGVACVAMCTGWSYTQALEHFRDVLGWGDKKSNFRTQPSHLKRVLDQAGMSYRVCKSRSWSDIEGTGIVGVNRDQGEWHWVVAVKDAERFLILDPETGEIYRHSQWPKDYAHGKGASEYFRFGDAARLVYI